MRRFSKACWFGTIAANFLLTVAAGAQDSKPRGLSPDALSCRTAIAKATPKLVSRGARTLADCHRGRDAGKIPPEIDCNVLSTSEADSSGRFASSRAKFVATIGRFCAGVDGFLVAPGFFTSCPEPCSSELSLPNPMTNLAQVGDCLACTVAEVVEDLSATTLGLPDPSTLGPNEAKCRGAIAGVYSKVLSSGHRAEFACQKRADSARHWDVADCVDEDASGKVASALAKAEAGLDQSCSEAALASLDSCGDDTLAGLRSCIVAETDAAGDETFSAAHELPATICPSALRLTFRAGCSTDSLESGGCTVGGRTDSTLLLGWTGLAHGIDVLDQVPMPLALDCPGAEAGSCGDCEILGLDAGDASAPGFARCDASPWIPCDEPFANDSDCGGGLCTTFLSPPLAASAGGTATCTLNRLVSDLGGTSDPDAGRTELHLDARAKVHHGLGLTQPCPICRGDATPRDGISSGTCSGGARDNEACDVQAFDANFAPTDEEEPTSGASLDCPPTAGANISGSGLRLELLLSTGNSSLPSGDACEPPNEASDCACGACSHDNSIPCRGDGDCDALMGGSVCGNGVNGAARAPNSCVGLACTPIDGANERGQCANLDRFCSGALHADGRGMLSCASDEDCAVFVTGSPDPDTWVCPGDDCGTCSVTANRSCFLDPVQVVGRADTENPLLAGLFCLPPTSGAGLNSTWGLPGPGEVKLDAIVTPVY